MHEESAYELFMRGIRAKCLIARPRCKSSALSHISDRLTLGLPRIAAQSTVDTPGVLY